MSKPYEVKVGQVYVDNDKRMAQRSLRVTEVVIMPNAVDSYAVCAIGLSGRTTKVRLRRFRPNSTGYRLVRDENGKIVGQ